MSSLRLFEGLLAEHRPPGTPSRSAARLARIVLRWREVLTAALAGIDANVAAKRECGKGLGRFL